MFYDWAAGEVFLILPTRGEGAFREAGAGNGGGFSGGRGLSGAFGRGPPTAQ